MYIHYIKKKIIYFLSDNTLKNTIYIVFGNSVFALSQWILISLVSKLTNMSILGFYTYSIAIVTTIFSFSNFNLRSIILSDSNNEYRKEDLLLFRIITTLLSIIITLIIGLLQNTDYYILCFVLGLRSIESIAEYFNSIQLKNNNFKNISISLSLKGIISIICTYIGLKLCQSLYYALIINIILYLIIFTYNDVLKYKKISTLSFKLNLKNINKIFTISLPLGFVMFLVTFNSNLNKFIINNTIGSVEQGVFSSFSYILIAGGFIINAYSVSHVSILSDHLKRNEIVNFKNKSIKLVLFSFIFGIILTLIAVVLKNTIIVLFFSPSMLEYSNLLIFIMIVGLFLYPSTSMGYIMTSMKLFKVQPIIFIIVVIINAVISLLLVPKFRLIGVTIGLFVSYLIQFSLFYFTINRKYKEIVSNNYG